MERQKINLIIDSHENKTSRDGKTDYTRYKTNHGWISCFDSVIIEDTNKLKPGTIIDCEITTDDKDRKVLQEVLGVVEEGGTGEKRTTVLTPSVSKTPITTSYEPKSMYVSYAKDLFIALLQADGEEIENKSGIGIMDMAVGFIKQAETSFK